jgi:hypothetical protein
MLERRIAAKSASSIFYEDYNDIDVYIEDTAEGYRKLFKEILNKALNGQFSIEQVFPIGNSSQVIEECEKNQAPSERKKLYIIDGDLVLLNGWTREDLKGLFILPRYCIENYLIDEQAIYQVAYEEDSEIDMDKIKELLDFQSWLNLNETHLVNLFIIYAICFRYLPHQQTVGFKVKSLCSSNTGIVCPTKVETRIIELKDKLINLFGEEKLNHEIAITNERIKNKGDRLVRYVSGKDYLLPLLITRLQSFMRFSSNSTLIRIRLAMKSDVSELNNIVTYIAN